jgi:type IV pilus assembly protein PilE
MKSLSAGFTLIELLVTVAIVGILTALALPAYQDYVTRGRLTEAFTTLSSAQAAAEQFWDDRRTYVGMTAPADTPNFTYTATNLTASTFTLKATGLSTGRAAGFQFTIDQTGARATPAVPSGWATSTTCWTDRRDGSCVQ